MASTIQKDIDKIIDLYFKQSLILYEHLFSSYHQFIEEIIPYCLKQEKNYFYENLDGNLIHFHGFRCTNIRIKPATFDNDNEIKFPSEARKNHLNYFASIIVDIVQYVETTNILTGEKKIKDIHTENNIAIGNVPIMIKSKYCSTYIKKDNHNECKYDPGGYFLVNGKEKIIMSIEKMVDNKILIFTKKELSYDNGIVYNAHINSRKNDWSDNLQIATIKNRKDGVISLTSSQLVDIPIFILMRAFGLESDQEIISNICYNLEDVKMLNLLRPSMMFSQDEEGNMIRTKEEAINYLISKLNKTKRISQTDEELAKKQKTILLEKILRQDLLQHLGEDIPKKRAFIGMMVNKLLLVMLNKSEPDDRDALHNKRIETPGILLGQLFRQNWKKMLSEIGKLFRKKNLSDSNPINVISQLKPSTIEQGIKTVLATGSWGMNRTKNGVAQALQRLSWIQSQSYLRRVLSPNLNESTSSVTSIRHVNNNQYKFLCVTGDTEVLLSNKIDTIQIKNINNSNWITTINPKTLHDEPSSIHSYFTKMPDKLYELSTISGRKIKATADHPFLIYDNNEYKWVALSNLKINDKIIVRHLPKYIPNENITKVLINENTVLENYKIELLEIGLLNKYLPIDKLKIIARLIGSLNTDGHIDEFVKDNGVIYYNSSFYVGEESDVFQIADDINNLGFGKVSISRKISNFEDKISGRITTTRTWEVTKNGAFSYFMTLLGGFKGKKTNIKRTIPDWLLTSEKSIKREFLSAFQGGDGSRLSYQKNSINWKPNLGITGQTTTNEFLNDTILYMNDIVKMFIDFDIKCHIFNEKIDNTKTKICIIFDKTTENLAKYCDIINYTYCEEKRRMSAPIIEHIKIREQYQQERLNNYKYIIENYKTTNIQDLVNHTNISENQIRKIMSKNNKGITICPRYISENNYNEFIKENIHPNGCISISIKSIKEIPVEPVYDFTTYSDNHSFVASSFVTHNCPVETPEGQKIGIVKSVAMMASITTQNNSQEKVLNTILDNNSKIKHPADINPLEMNDYIKILINGNWVGVIKIKYSLELYNDLKNKRRDSIIDKYTTMLFDYDKKEMRIYFDGGRLIRPLLMVNNNLLSIDDTVINTVDELLQSDIYKGWKNLLHKHKDIIEYEDIETCNFLMIAERPEKLHESIENSQNVIEYNESSKINRYGDYKFMNYTHCEFAGWVMLGTTAANIAFMNHDYATKCIVHFSQAKQTIGVYLTSYKDRMDISQILYHPQVPLAQTKAMKYNNFLDMPYGENAIVALMSYTGLLISSSYYIQK
jgi:DNA-directed RNA polymerase beta subunit/intein/homing endonuclease